MKCYYYAKKTKNINEPETKNKPLNWENNVV